MELKKQFIKKAGIIMSGVGLIALSGSSVSAMNALENTGDTGVVEPKAVINKVSINKQPLPIKFVIDPSVAKATVLEKGELEHVESLLEYNSVTKESTLKTSVLKAGKPMTVAIPSAGVYELPIEAMIVETVDDTLSGFVPVVVQEGTPGMATLTVDGNGKLINKLVTKEAKNKLVRIPKLVGVPNTAPVVADKAELKQPLEAVVPNEAPTSSGIVAEPKADGIVAKPVENLVNEDKPVATLETAVPKDAPTKQGFVAQVTENGVVAKPDFNLVNEGKPMADKDKLVKEQKAKEQAKKPITVAKTKTGKKTLPKTNSATVDSDEAVKEKEEGIVAKPAENLVNDDKPVATLETAVPKDAPIKQGLVAEPTADGVVAKPDSNLVNEDKPMADKDKLVKEQKAKQQVKKLPKTSVATGVSANNSVPGALAVVALAGLSLVLLSKRKGLN